jgi:hypothetical protein
MAISPINQRIADTARHAENKGRLAFASGRMQSSGQGTFEFEDVISFGLTFVERPFIATGFQIDMDQAREALGVGDGDLHLPQVTAYVTDWDMTDKEHYVGAWVAVTVTHPPIELADYRVDAQVKIWHDFTFSAIAIKDIPTDI